MTTQEDEWIGSLVERITKINVQPANLIAFVDKEMKEWNMEFK
jgi:hypothetical protein